MTRLFKILASLGLMAGLAAAPTASFAGISIGIGISVGYAPPALPYYAQPPCPAPNLIWTPGYWGYQDAGYYWVPGAWVAAPQPGYLWTPGYWGYNGGAYRWNAGYWGSRVGFYGGVNYGFGYFGNGFYGGRWIGNRFSYNTAYVNVNRTVINNTYINKTVINNYNTHVTRVSYNGGPGGTTVQATRRQLQYRETGRAATFAQERHVERASQNRDQFASVNHGRPIDAAITHSPETTRATSTRASDPFSRFNHGSQNVPNASRPAYRSDVRTYGAGSQAVAHPARTYEQPRSGYRPADATYRNPGTDRRPASYGTVNRPQGPFHPSYRQAPNAYRPQSSAHAQHGPGPQHGDTAQHGEGHGRR